MVAYLLVTSFLVLAIFSGHNQAIENISLLGTIVLLATTFLGMFIKREPPPKTNTVNKYIAKSMWGIAILFFAAYGLWIQSIAMILSVVFLKSSGDFYKEKIKD